MNKSQIALTLLRMKSWGIRSATFAKPILLHGDDASAWPLLRRAIESGFSTRIGLEDARILPNGSVARSNTELVAAAAHLIRAARSPAAETAGLAEFQSHSPSSSN